jgi:hypothetical protein
MDRAHSTDLLNAHRPLTLFLYWRKLLLIGLRKHPINATSNKTKRRYTCGAILKTFHLTDHKGGSRIYSPRTTFINYNILLETRHKIIKSDPESGIYAKFN